MIITFLAVALCILYDIPINKVTCIKNYNENLFKDKGPPVCVGISVRGVESQMWN